MPTTHSLHTTHTTHRTPHTPHTPHPNTHQTLNVTKTIQTLQTTKSMPKTKRINTALQKLKNEELHKRSVLQDFSIDDFQVDDALKPALKKLIGNKVKVRTTAKTVDNYFRSVNKLDKEPFDETLIHAKADYTGDKDDKYYELLRIDNFYTRGDKVELNVCWRGINPKTKKRYKNSVIKTDMLRNPKTLQHKVEFDTIFPSMKKWSNNMAKWYAITKGEQA